MRSVRIAAAAGIVATGLALGAAGIASAATPTPAPAPAPAQVKSAPVKAAPATSDRSAPVRIVKVSPTKARAIAEARSAQAKTAALSARAVHANYVVTASHLNVRTGPGTKFRVAGTLAKGARVVASTKIVNGFRQLSSGHWVSVHYLKAA
ncbi:MAG TPA: hypothetical protein VGM75_32070 [Pseudonocardiaceae bacterium]|jgi:uncharacterized protein YgiM (DUF1202 family)